MAWKIYYEAKLDHALTSDEKAKVKRHQQKWEQVRWKFEPYRIAVDPDQSSKRRTILMGVVGFPDDGDSRAIEMEAEKILMALGELKRSMPDVELDVQDSQGRIRYDYGRLRFVIGPPTPGFQMREKASFDDEEEEVEEEVSSSGDSDDGDESAGPVPDMGSDFGRIRYFARRSKALSVQEEQVIWRLQDHWWKKGDKYQEIFQPRLLTEPDDDWVVIKGTIKKSRPHIDNNELLDILSHLKALLADLQWSIEEQHGRIAWNEDAGTYKEIESPLLHQDEEEEEQYASPGVVGKKKKRKKHSGWGAVEAGFKGMNSQSIGGNKLKSGSDARVKVSGWSFTADKDINGTWINVSGPLDNPFPLAAEFRGVVTLRDKTERVVYVDNKSIGLALQAEESGTVSASIELSAEIWMKVVDVHIALDYRLAGQLEVGRFKIDRS